MRTPVFFLLVLCGALPGCDFLWHPGEPATFENVEEARVLNVSEAGVAVFSDAASWEAFWYEHVGVTPTPPPPPINFERKTAGALFWGQHTGCENGVEAVERVRRSGPRAVVEVGPLPDLGPCDAIVYPVQVITFRKARSVEFEGDVPG